MHRFPAISVEEFVVTIEIDEDPTGQAPEFLVVSEAGGDPAAWVDGSWSTSWSSVTRRVTARSASFGGAAAALPMDPDVAYKLLLRVGGGPVREVAWLVAVSADPEAVAAV